MDWSCRISRVHNGYIVAWVDTGEVLGWFAKLLLSLVVMFTPKVQQVVFSEPDTEAGEVEAMHQMLWHIVEYFNMQGSKHDPYRIRVSVEKGDE